MGRPPIGQHAMTNAERQRRYRIARAEAAAAVPRVERLAKVWSFRIRKKRDGRFDLLQVHDDGRESVSMTADSLARIERFLDSLSGAVQTSACGSIYYGTRPVLREAGRRMWLEPQQQMTAEQFAAWRCADARRPKRGDR